MQIPGFLILLSISFALDKSILKLILAVFLSFIYFKFDTSMMGSKIVLLIYAYSACSLNSSRLKAFFFSEINNFQTFKGFLLLTLISLSIIQYIWGLGEPGVFDSKRVSAFFWDPNYFALIIIFNWTVFSFWGASSFLLVALAQSTTITIALLLHLFSKYLNLIIFCLLLLFVLYLPIAYEQGILDTDNEWLNSRIFSMYLRSSWAQALFLGDTLQDIAPHISFISGMKKNMVMTFIFFIYFLWLPRIDLRTKSFLLVTSFNVDVFFGPACFFVPIFAVCSKLKFSELSKTIK